MTAIERKAENAAATATRSSFDHIEQASLLLIGVILAAALMTVLAILGSFRVARATRRANAMLRESQTRFKDIAEVSSDWFWEMDENLQFSYHSPRYFEITGFRPEDKIGTARTRYAGLDDLDRDAGKWAAHMKDLEARRPFKNFEFAFKTKNGATINASISGTPILDADGAFQGYRGTGAEITNRKRAEEELKIKSDALKEALSKEQKLNKLQREFVSMASHEFRTPLAIIDGIAQRIKRRADTNRLTPEDAVQRVEKIRAAVKRMTRLMDSTLAAARMQEGKIEIEIEPCDIGNIIREVCERQLEIAQTHVISCDLADLPATIQADSGSVEQILANLLSNAVKYAPDAPDIEVTARTQGDQVAISVRDRGIGIDADELGRIGERFSRAKTSAGIAGTGIGLNLARTLVEMHGGSVTVESKKGEGSTFTVRLPIAGPDQSEQAETKVA